MIHCVISGPGPDGPLGGLSGYNVVIQTIVGLMSVNGGHDGGPMHIGLPIVDMVIGLSALADVLLVLAEREESGYGQSIDIALYDCGVSLLYPHLSNYLGSSKVPQRSGNAHPSIAPYGNYQTDIVPISLTVGNDHQFARLCAHVGAAGLAQDVCFTDNRNRCAHRAELKVALEARLARFDCEVLAQNLVHSGVPCGPVLNADVVARHPHALHRQMVAELGEHRGTDSPIKLSRTPAMYRNASPALGADTGAVLASLGIDADARRCPSQVGILK